MERTTCAQCGRGIERRDDADRWRHDDGRQYRHVAAPKDQWTATAPGAEVPARQEITALLREVGCTEKDINTLINRVLRDHDRDLSAWLTSLADTRHPLSALVLRDTARTLERGDYR